MIVPDVSDVRSAFDIEGFEKFIKNPSSNSLTTLGVNVPTFQGPIEVKQFKFGQSNPTYYVTDSSGRKFVLRRKPSPNSKLVSRSAHAIEREFFILRGIGILNAETARTVPVPDVYLLCEDESVIGFVFYLMEYVSGRQLKNPSMPELSREQADVHWKSIMDTITAIHSLNSLKLIAELPAKHFPQFQPDKIEKLKNSSYFQRQIKTLSSVEKLQSRSVDPIPSFDKIVDFLLTHAPNDPSDLTLVHGDFKIDNILFHPSEARVMAVLDWELCTFGHPLFDLSNFLQPFQLPNKLNLMLFYPEKTDMGSENAESSATVHSKLELYSNLLDHPWNGNEPQNNATDLCLVGYVFGLLRLCVISQGIAVRVKKGNASSATASGYAGMYPFLANLALSSINGFENEQKGAKL